MKIIYSLTGVFRNCFILKQAVAGIFFSSIDSLPGFFLFFEKPPFDKIVMRGTLFFKTTGYIPS